MYVFSTNGRSSFFPSSRMRSNQNVEYFFSRFSNMYVRIHFYDAYFYLTQRIFIPRIPFFLEIYFSLDNLPILFFFPFLNRCNFIVFSLHVRLYVSFIFLKISFHFMCSSSNLILSRTVCACLDEYSTFRGTRLRVEHDPPFQKIQAKHLVTALSRQTQEEVKSMIPRKEKVKTRYIRL